MTDSIQSNSHIKALESSTITSDTRIIARADIEKEYNVPGMIRPTMRNADTVYLRGGGGRGDGGFRVL